MFGEPARSEVQADRWKMRPERNWTGAFPRLPCRRALAYACLYVINPNGLKTWGTQWVSVCMYVSSP